MTDENAAASPAPQKPQRKWLYASVALNLLLAGVLAGGALHRFDGPRGFRHPPPPMAMRDLGFAFLRALPDERRKEISQKMRSQFGDMKPLFAESIAARKEAFALLEKDSVTPEDLKTAFARVQAVDTQASTRAAGFFADFVVGLPAAERKAAVAKMRERWTERENMRMRLRGEEGDRPGPPGGRPCPPDGKMGPLGEKMGPRDDVFVPGDGPPPPPRD
jgi:uncharacterized membrane protein